MKRVTEACAGEQQDQDYPVNGFLVKPGKVSSAAYLGWAIISECY